MKRAQDVFSNKRGSHCSLEQTLEAMTELFLQRQDPIEKAKKRVVSKSVNYEKKVCATHSEGKRTSIPADIEHGVNLRDKVGKYADRAGGSSGIIWWRCLGGKAFNRQSYVVTTIVSCIPEVVVTG